MNAETCTKTLRNNLRALSERADEMLEITGIEDRGIQQGADAGGSTVDTGKRIIAVTVRSHVPGTLSGLDNFLPHDLDGDGRDEMITWGRHAMVIGKR